MQDLQTQRAAPLEFRLIQGAETESQFSALLDQGFGLSGGAHYLDDFPIWSERFSELKTLRLGIFRGSRLLSAVSLRFATLKTSRSARMAVALIGAVVTEVESRGQGLASQLIQAATRLAEEGGAAGVFLWASDHGIYMRHGFLPMGQQWRVPLEALEFGQSEPTAEIVVNKGWNPALFHMICNRPDGLAHSPTDLGWYQAHKNVCWFWAGSQEAPTAYAAVGRGIDLQNIVHEWGGDSVTLHSLLRELRTRESSLQLLATEKLLDKNSLAVRNEDVIVESLCLARPITDEFSKLIAEPESFWIWGLDAV